MESCHRAARTRCGARVGVLCLSLGFAFIAGGQISFERLRSFGFIDQLGDSPAAALLAGSDGWLYGTTIFGGVSDKGTVFKIGKDGAGYVTLHQFTGTNGDGSSPAAALIEGSDGELYGTTYSGGNGNAGTVFKVKKDGSGYSVVLSLVTATRGANPQAALLEGSDGRLYGAARSGGFDGLGTLFRLQKDGGSFELLHDFSGVPGDGKTPFAGLIEASDGALYGTTHAGGDANAGVVFRINRDGSDFALLHSFTPASDGQGPSASLMEGSDGVLYGTTRDGGNAGLGTVFKMTRDGNNFAALHHFGQSGDGQNPYGGLVEGSDGAIRGTTRNGGTAINGTAFKLKKDGAGYSVLHHFDGSAGDGYRPEGGLVMDQAGNLYGTTRLGGRANIGAIFKMNSDGTGYAQLRSFTFNGNDAMRPYASVLEGSDGALFGMTTEGGSQEFGAIFRFKNDGSGYAILHNFDPDTDDGINPFGGLIEGSDGVLYGATRYGGGADLGTVFKINRDGEGYTLLHRFTNSPGTGRYPIAGVLEASDGMLYGRTISGGAADGATIFRLNKNGTGFAIVYSFALAGGSRFDPYSNLIEASDGALYGTSYEDGSDRAGTIFKINKDGSAFELLHTFLLSGGDGTYPESGLLEGTDGALYGTTSFGGDSDEGTVFKVNKNGSGYRVLRSFNSAGDEGYWPNGELVEDAGGLLFGVTYFGGINDLGVIYAISKDGSAFSVLHRFAPDSAQGENPISGLTRARDGGWYGTACYGADINCGSLYRLAPWQVGGRASPAGFHLTITGGIGQRYAVDGTAVLPPTWTQIGLLTNLTGTAEWIDPMAGGTQRWYRARWILP